MSSVVEMNVSLMVSEQLNRQMVNVAQEVTEKCVEFLASKFKFNADEAKELIGMIKLERKEAGKAKAKVAKTEKMSTPKPRFPLPYNGELNEDWCFALRQNSGLFTQCTGARRNGDFCKGCASQMQKMGAETPECGTIQQRMAVGIFEYVDPKGRKPIAYTKIMKKYKITEEQVKEEAGKFNMIINAEHFIAPEETKRGRPKSDKAPKEKGAKGRPKKAQISLEIEGDDMISEEAAKVNFKELVRETIEEAESPKHNSGKKVKSDEEKEAERLAKEAEKKEKEAKRLAEKAEKEAKLAAEKAEKEAKKKAEEEARAAKKAAEEAEKQAKKEAAELAKKEKEAKLAAEKAAKEAKKSDKSEKSNKKAKADAEPVEDDEEPDVVKKIEFQGKKYLKSKKTGIVYDYNMYVKESQQVVIGKWCETTNKIVFNNDEEEEEEEEYDD
jgi:hypothetical protein